MTWADFKGKVKAVLAEYWQYLAVFGAGLLIGWLWLR